jgi:NADP-dependent 3-hydroxy acid dehydrogenase YdfG
LKREGNDCLCVLAAEDGVAGGEGRSVTIDPTCPTDYEQLATVIRRPDAAPLAGIVHLWSLRAGRIAHDSSDGELERAQQWGCQSVLYALQALAREQRFGAPASWWLVTQGVAPVECQIAPAGLAQAPLWGMGRVMALELAQAWGGILDLAPAGNVNLSARWIADELRKDTAEDQVALRSGGTYVARLRPMTFLQRAARSLDSEATYLVTGGTGALGWRIAECLVTRGARHLALLSRTGPRIAPAGRSNMSRLEAAGAEVVLLSADVTQRPDLERALGQLCSQMPPLRGIIHAAGVLDDGVLTEQTWDRFARVIAPKLTGTWNLHELTQDAELDFFVCVSSIAAVVGLPGQGNYAAANAFLGAFVEHRRATGRVAQVIQWGPLSGGGMASDEILARLARIGIGALSPEQARTSLEALLNAGESDAMVAKVDWPTFAPVFAPARQRALLGALLPRSQVSCAADVDSILSQLRTTPSHNRRRVLARYLQNATALVLGFERDRLPDCRVGFSAMGMDSLMVLGLRDRLQADLQLTLPATVTLDYPTIDALSDYLTELLFHDTSELEPKGGGATVPGLRFRQTSPNNSEKVDNGAVQHALALQYSKLKQMVKGH